MALWRRNMKGTGFSVGRFQIEFDLFRDPRTHFLEGWRSYPGWTLMIGSPFSILGWYPYIFTNWRLHG